MVFLKDR